MQVWAEASRSGVRQSPALQAPLSCGWLCQGQASIPAACGAAAMPGCGSEERGRAGWVAAAGRGALPPEVWPPRGPPKGTGCSAGAPMCHGAPEA